MLSWNHRFLQFPLVADSDASLLRSCEMTTVKVQ